MVKLKSPLFSHTASGAIAENLTYSSRHSGQQCRFQKKQKDVLSASRSVQRSKYRLAYLAWLSLSISERENWKSLAYNQNITGYNMFVQNYLLAVSDPAYYGYAIFGSSIYGDV